MKNFSFIFAGTSEFARECLEILLSLPNLNLKGVISRPSSSQGRGKKKKESPVSLLAQKKNYPLWKPRKGSDSSFLSEISQQKCDFSFVCSYGQILPLSYLQLFPKGSFNLHLSALPRWRGAAPIQRALMAGDKKSAICLQLMTEELDAGDIVGQRDFPIGEEDNAEDLFKRALKETPLLLKENLMQYLRGEITARKQEESQKSYAKKIDKKEGQIVWEESATNIHNKIRALFSGPQAFSFLEGKRLKIYRSRPLPKSSDSFLPGEVCQIDKDHLIVSCGEGLLSILEIQKEGKKRQKIKDFLKGSQIELKSQFHSS